MNGALNLIKRLIVYLPFEAFRAFCVIHAISSQLSSLFDTVSKQANRLALNVRLSILFV